MRMSRRIMTSAGAFSRYDYSFTGTSEFIDEGSGNWHINFTDSGTLTLRKSVMLDLYLLGGGQCGSTGSNDSIGNNRYYYGGAGGQGGYTNKPTRVIFAPGEYTVTVGQGGTGGNSQAGGTTVFGTYSAPGGGSGASASGTVKAGASGGRGYGYTSSEAAANGSDSTVYDFEGKNRGGGGGGGQRAVNNTSSGSWSYSGYSRPMKGGQMGGGGGDGTSTTYYDAQANYGGGGGGRNASSGGAAGKAGSSGIVQIRNAR